MNAKARTRVPAGLGRSKTLKEWSDCQWRPRLPEAALPQHKDPKGRSPGSRGAGHPCRTCRLPRSEDPVACGTTQRLPLRGQHRDSNLLASPVSRLTLWQFYYRRAPIGRLCHLRSRAERILSFNQAEIASRLNLLNLIKTQLTLCLLRPIVRAMDSNLSLLEQKLDQLISLLEKSRSLNEDLRARLTATETRCQQLETQMDAARNKLEQVVAHLPETTSLS